MQKRTQSFTLILLVLLAGCATEQKRSGLPIWDFERDELKNSAKVALGSTIFGLLLCPNGDSKCVTTGASILGAIGGVIQDSIELTPPELNRVISNALAPTAILSAPTVLSSNLVAAAPNITQWTISESNEGQITTDWKPIPGKKVGVLWWEKTFECEARHLITIKRSYQSSQFTNFTIVTEVRERPNVNYPWATADPELGRASFENLKNLLLISVNAELNKRRTKK